MITFEQAELALANFNMFGIKLGLDNVRDLLEVCGNPHDDLKFIHLAGTNGKGSTSCLIHGALVESGFKVGIFTSPHLVSVRERIRVNGEPIAGDSFAAAFEFVVERLEALNGVRCELEACAPTYFELMTVLAIVHFANKGVDFVVWETGMGGRLDSTNVVMPILSVITNVAVDHCMYLGDTLEEITVEKAGIIKAGIPVFYGGAQNVSLQIVSDRCEEVGAQCFHRGADFGVKSYDILGEGDVRLETRVTMCNLPDRMVRTQLWGGHQAENVSLATAVLKYLSITHGVDFERCLEGMTRAQWPGRLQFVRGVGGQDYLLDGAHNVHAAEGLVKSLRTLSPDKRWDIVVGILADKQPQRIFDVLAPIARSFTLVKVPNPRSFEPDEVVPMLCLKFPNVDIKVADIDQLPKFAQGGEVLVTGSLYLIGAFLSQVNGGELPPILS